MGAEKDRGAGVSNDSKYSNSSICGNCGHRYDRHNPETGCEFERGDRWVDYGNGDRLKGDIDFENNVFILNAQAIAKQVRFEHPHCQMLAASHVRYMFQSSWKDAMNEAGRRAMFPCSSAVKEQIESLEEYGVKDLVDDRDLQEPER